jgi:hypothetical protein
LSAHALLSRREASFNDTLGHTAKNISLAETLVADPRERRVVRDGIFDAEPTKPAIPPANARPNIQNA